MCAPHINVFSTHSVVVCETLPSVILYKSCDLHMYHVISVLQVMWSAYVSCDICTTSHVICTMYHVISVLQVMWSALCIMWFVQMWNQQQRWCEAWTWSLLYITLSHTHLLPHTPHHTHTHTHTHTLHCSTMLHHGYEQPPRKDHISLEKEYKHLLLIKPPTVKP